MLKIFRKYNNPFNKIYCISLNKSVNRKKHIVEELSRNNIENYEFVDAIDKDNAIVENAYAEGTVKLFPPCFRCGMEDCKCNNNVLLPMQVATFLSQIKVWTKVSIQKQGLYLIIEDDIKFNHYYRYMKYVIYWKINTLFSKYNKEPFLLRLGWTYNQDHCLQRIKLVQNLVKMSNPMYAINPVMAKKLLEHFNKITTTVDVYINQIAALKYVNYTLLPPLTYDTPTSNVTRPSHIRPHIECINSLKITNDNLSQKKLEIDYTYLDRAIRRKILVVGHPRTGSGYTSALLKAYGLDVGHEKMGDDGIVSWMFTVYDLNNPYFQDNYAKSRYFTVFDHVIMCVRDPFTAIPSIMRENSDSSVSLHFREKHIKNNFGTDINIIESEFEKAIMVYSLWVKLAKEKNNLELLMRIEKDEYLLQNYLHSCGYKVQMKDPTTPPKDINSNKIWMGKISPKPLLSDSDWLNLKRDLKVIVNQLCYQLGYGEIFNHDMNKLLRKIN